MEPKFKRSDILNQGDLQRDIEATYGRLLSNPKNLDGSRGNRDASQLLIDTEQGLVLEYYLMQNYLHFKKATSINPQDYWHDLIDTNSGEIHECKITRSKEGWRDIWLWRKLAALAKSNYNKSKWVHLAIYNPESETYIYQGVRPMVDYKV